MSLRSDLGLEVAPDLQSEAFLKTTRGWQERGLAHFDGKKIRLASKGYLILDSLISDLFSLKII